MDKKELINKLILDLAQDAPMSQVMLMAQAVSFELQNKLFSDWIRKEQRGYDKCKDNEIPSYREVSCILKVDLNPFGIALNSKPIEFEMSWDEIFALVGGTFISPVRTNHAVDIISKIVCTFKGQNMDYFLDAACGQTILSQLYALRYLDLRTGEVFQSGVESYYVLTDYGMKEYVKLTAQKRC